MPVATPQHKEAGTVSRYLLPKPPRHSPSLLSSPRPGSHHGFSADPQACLQEIRQLASPGGALLAGASDHPSTPPFGRRTPSSVSQDHLLDQSPNPGYPSPLLHRASPGGYDLRDIGHRRPPGKCRFFERGRAPRCSSLQVHASLDGRLRRAFFLVFFPVFLTSLPLDAGGEEREGWPETRVPPGARCWPLSPFDGVTWPLSSRLFEMALLTATPSSRRYSAFSS